MGQVVPLPKRINVKNLELKIHAVKTALMESHPYADEFMIKRAMLGVVKVLQMGGEFMDAMDAGTKVIGSEIEDFRRFIEMRRNMRRLDGFREKQHKLFEARMESASVLIRDRLKGHSERSVSEALVRARRIIDGNGTVFMAVCRGIENVQS